MFIKIPNHSAEESQLRHISSVSFQSKCTEGHIISSKLGGTENPLIFHF